jgi:outer membrane protein assembly factor BamB
MRARFHVLVFLTLLAGACVGQAITAGDWPAWRGPERTGVSKETGLLKEWPEDGPKLVWKIKGLGSGYSTPSVAGGKIYVMGTKSGSEHVFCLDVKDGKELWAADAGPGGRSMGFTGPRSTPSVVDGRVYALSSAGRLVCLNADNGKSIWKKNLDSEYGGKTGMWAYAESPLVDGDVVIATPGGSKATLVALKARDGAEVWKAPVTGLKMKEIKGGFGGKFGGKFGKDRGGKGGKGGMFGGKGKSEYNTAAYSSPIAAEVGGVKQYIQFLTGGVVGISAKDGKLLWHYDEPSCVMANCSTPLFRDGAVFAASAYGNGGGKAVISHDNGKFKAEQKFFVRSLQNQHGNMVLVGDHIYGTNDQTLMCVSFKDGTVAWQSRGVGKGSVAYADGHIYHRGERGDIALVEASPSGYKQKGRFRQPDRSDQNTWASPVIADGKLYLRDGNVLLCYDIKAEEK